ncbi:MAG: diguanylate cyclase [Acidobacteria bacterium]|nr:diguanylate cyclase [Thermoanaerobaculia bacterium]NLN12084.1 diguanylate cyclase [Acidobacteriota bacterium]MBP7814264.1 diguanylate cyclase [Thermoanaerobaculia bacterium]MBP8845248.1 diguanylate cyclase [Thermoanaerobaculia bacterium]HPA95556.1 diguanylate cyclase [Thermoanaerobaculia bacterium]
MRPRAARRLFPLGFLAAVLVARAGAQVLPFEVLGLEEGLPQSQVADVAQDADGYLWVATWGGLARYDGESFTPFFVGQGLPSNRVQELLLDRGGVLWIATGSGLSVWRDRRLAPVSNPNLDGQRCRALAEDGEGRLWVGSDSGVLVREGEGFRPVGPAGGIVYDLFPDRGAMLAATAGGLLRLAADGAVELLPTPPLPPDTLRAVARTADGLWLGTAAQGVFLEAAGGWRPVPPPEIAGRNVYRFVVGASGTFYVATQDGGLSRKPPGGARFEHLSTANGMPTDVVSTAFEDAEGNLWIGTDIGGLVRALGEGASHHGVRGEFPSPCVFGIAPGGSADSLWVATLRGAVHYQVRPHCRVLETVGAREGLRDQHVWKVVTTPEGELWVQTETIYQVRPPGADRFAELPPSVPAPQTTQDIAVDAAGRLWLAGYDPAHGVAMRDRSGRWHAWSASDDGVDVRRCRVVAPRRSGEVLVATGREILVSDGERLRRHCDPPPLAGTYISALFEDSRGRLWAGNDAGLARRETDGRWRLLNDEPGLASHHVFFAGESRDGTVWIGTARGAYRFLPGGRVEPFTLDDGLAGLEANQFGFFADPAGEVWIGTVAGLTRFDPAGRHENAVPPRLVVESAGLPTRSIAYPAALDLGWRERTIDFRVAVLAFRNHARAAFRARLDGLENAWLPLRRPGELRYTNLSPGSYRLLLQAANESGVWAEKVALPIRVHPPWWQTVWFRVAAAAAALALAVGIHRARTLALRRRNEELARAVEARTAELRAANAELEHLATHEPLTGRWNRRAILEQLRAHLAPRGTASRRFGCLLVDLDGFKRVNDTCGHAAGDRVLAAAAEQLARSTREHDLVGRYGGDEFLLLLPDADRDAVTAVAERVGRIQIHEGEGAGALTVTASCGGVAVAAGAGLDETAVLAAADALLYRVKQAGGRGALIETLAPAPGDPPAVPAASEPGP